MTRLILCFILALALPALSAIAQDAKDLSIQSAAVNEMIGKSTIEFKFEGRGRLRFKDYTGPREQLPRECLGEAGTDAMVKRAYGNASIGYKHMIAGETTFSFEGLVKALNEDHNMVAFVLFGTCYRHGTAVMGVVCVDPYFKEGMPVELKACAFGTGEFFNRNNEYKRKP